MKNNPDNTNNHQPKSPDKNIDADIDLDKDIDYAINLLSQGKAVLEYLKLKTISSILDKPANYNLKKLSDKIQEKLEETPKITKNQKDEMNKFFSIIEKRNKEINNILEKTCSFHSVETLTPKQLFITALSESVYQTNKQQINGIPNGDIESKIGPISIKLLFHNLEDYLQIFDKGIQDEIRKHPQGVQPRIFDTIKPLFQKHLVALLLYDVLNKVEYDEDSKKMISDHEHLHITCDIFISIENIIKEIRKCSGSFKVLSKLSTEECFPHIKKAIDDTTNLCLKYLIREETISYISAGQKNIDKHLKDLKNQINAQEGSILGYEIDKYVVKNTIIKALNKERIKLDQVIDTSKIKYFKKNKITLGELINILINDSVNETISLYKTNTEDSGIAKPHDILRLTFDRLRSNGYSESDPLLLFSPLIGHPLDEWPEIAKQAPKIN
ncbi:MAG: hypothetical protein WC570_03190 [Patescibacteria group bacterium]